MSSFLQWPLGGLLRTFIFEGLARVVYEGSDVGSLSNEELAYVLESAAKYFREERLKNAVAGRLSGNDSSSYSRTFLEWFHSSPPSDYLSLVLEVVEQTAKLLRSGELDVKQSLSSIKVGKEVRLGVEFKDSWAILPSIVKQVEYYESLSQFLKPTTGFKSMVYLDPVWFSLLAIGFLTSFAGYYGGRYYFIVKEGIENFLDEPTVLRDIIEGIDILASANMSRRIPLHAIETFEMSLAMELAERNASISEESYPFTLLVVELAGRVFIAVRSLEIDLRVLSSFMQKYVNLLQAAGASGKVKGLMIRFKDREGNEVSLNPLEALIEVANRELSRAVSGDNEMIAYLMCKDLYRAINAGSVAVMENSLMGLGRKARALMETRSEKVDWLLKRALSSFISRNHVEVLLEAISKA